MFAKLALRNVRRQIGSYLIYFVTVALSVALMFAVNNLIYSERMQQFARENTDIRTMFRLITGFVLVITALVLSYATGFMLKLRRKEFGMYLTLGMTRRNIRTLFVCETWILSGLAVLVGIGLGLVIFQLLMALFSSIMEMPVAISAYAPQGILLTVAASAGIFTLATFGSVRYLKRVGISELLQEEQAEKREKHPALWCGLCALFALGLVVGGGMTYRSLMASFANQSGVSFLLWLVLDLVLIFLFHVALARSVAGMLLKSKKLKNRGTNTVVLRGLSGKMTINALLIGALATLLVFAMGASNLGFSEKVYADREVDKECPYDVMAQYSTRETHPFTMAQGEAIIENYSPITGQIAFSLHSLDQTTLCSSVLGYDMMGWTDKFLPLSQFNTLLAGCGYEPVALEQEYLAITIAPGICDVDFSDKVVTGNGGEYTWAGTSMQYPDFTDEWLYFVIPDAAVADMPVVDQCAAYTLENPRPDVSSLLQDLIYLRQTDDGVEERCDYALREDYRLWLYSNAGVMIIGMLYLSTVFVCMALAILSLKTLSTLRDERRRFAILYQLGADVPLQKRTLRRQTAAFFLMPFGLPFALSIPMGCVFGKIYEAWGFAGLVGRQAMTTAGIIALVMFGVYGLYFCLTDRIACNYVLCYGADAGALTADGRF